MAGCGMVLPPPPSRKPPGWLDIAKLRVTTCDDSFDIYANFAQQVSEVTNATRLTPSPLERRARAQRASRAGTGSTAPASDNIGHVKMFDLGFTKFWASSTYNEEDAGDFFASVAAAECAEGLLRYELRNVADSVAEEVFKRILEGPLPSQYFDAFAQEVINLCERFYFAYNSPSLIPLKKRLAAVFRGHEREKYLYCEIRSVVEAKLQRERHEHSSIRQEEELYLFEPLQYMEVERQQVMQNIINQRLRDILKDPDGIRRASLHASRDKVDAAPKSPKKNDENERMQAELRQLLQEQNQIKQERKQILKATSEKHSVLEENMSDARNELAKVEELNRKLKAELDALRVQLDTKQRELEELQRKLSAMEGEENMLIEKLKELKNHKATPVELRQKEAQQTQKRTPAVTNLRPSIQPSRQTTSMVLSSAEPESEAPPDQVESSDDTNDSDNEDARLAALESEKERRQLLDQISQLEEAIERLKQQLVGERYDIDNGAIPLERSKEVNKASRLVISYSDFKLQREASVKKNGTRGIFARLHADASKRKTRMNILHDVEMQGKEEQFLQRMQHTIGNTASTAEASQNHSSKSTDASIVPRGHTWTATAPARTLNTTRKIIAPTAPILSQNCIASENFAAPLQTRNSCSLNRRTLTSVPPGWRPHVTPPCSRYPSAGQVASLEKEKEKRKIVRVVGGNSGEDSESCTSKSSTMQRSRSSSLVEPEPDDLVVWQKRESLDPECSGNNDGAGTGTGAKLQTEDAPKTRARKTNPWFAAKLLETEQPAPEPVPTGASHRVRAASAGRLARSKTAEFSEFEDAATQRAGSAPQWCTDGRNVLSPSFLSERGWL